ncbi:MAG: flagellar hook-length control protein FliK [Oxalobacteraceae bacterium]
MNSVSTPAVAAAHHAKKHAKSSFSGLKGEDGGDFSGMLNSLQAGSEGQDLAAQTGKTSPPTEGLASQILGPSVHIITSEAPTLSDDSLYAFARSQGMDESALALIFQRSANPLPADAALNQPLPADAAVLAIGQTNTDAAGDALLLAQQTLAMQAAAPDAERVAADPSGAQPAADETTLPQPFTDGKGMSVLEFGSDASMRWSVGQPGVNAESAKPAVPDPAAKVAAELSQATAMSAAQHEKHEASGRELAATLVLGEAESKQFAKKLESKQLSLRAERLGSTTSETFKATFMNNGLLPHDEAAEAATAPDSLTLGADLTGEDLRMIWAHRQSVAEQSDPSSASGQTASPQSDIDLRAEQYEKLSQRLGEALGQRLASQIARGVWKVELALKPQDLGNIEIKLDMKDGALEASFKASEAMTRDLITDGLPKLKEALAQSGMQVANVNVNVRQDSQNGGNSTPGRNKTPAGISGVSKASLASASLPSDSVATGKPRASDNNGLDVLV